MNPVWTPDTRTQMTGRETWQPFSFFAFQTASTTPSPPLEPPTMADLAIKDSLGREYNTFQEQNSRSCGQEEVLGLLRGSQSHTLQQHAVSNGQCDCELSADVWFPAKHPAV